MLHQLSEPAHIPFGETQGRKRFNNEESVIRIVKFDLVDRSPWQNDIIAVTEAKFAVLRMDGTVTFMYKDHFISIGILIKISAGSAFRGREYNMAIVIHQHGHTTLQVLPAGLHLESFKATMLEHLLFCDLRRYINLWLSFDDLRWRITMV